MEFTNALKRPIGGAFGKFRLHHFKNAFVPEPVVVVGPVAIEPDERHHSDARLTRLGAGRQQMGAVIGSRIGHNGANPVSLHAGQHVLYRMRPAMAVPGLLVVMEVGVK